jgi:nicotinamidase-related amidase
VTLSTSDLTIDARRTALMLMDFQPAILGQVPDRDAVMDKAQIALGWARAHGVKVVFVRVAFVPDDYDAIPDHHKAFGTVKQNRLLAEGNPSFDIDPALEVRAGDTVVRKTRFGAFSTTDLHALFGDESINTLVMGGISTAGVVLSTVREASDQDYLDGETPEPNDTPVIGAVRVAVCYASAFGLRYRRGRRGFRSLEGAVEHRQGQDEDADPDQDGANEVHAGVGDVVAEGDSGDRR